MEKKLKILYLTPWYPDRYDAMPGLFVRKHAEAVTRHADVAVLYIHSDENVSRFDIVEQDFGRVREVLVYYPYSKNRLLSLPSKMVNYVRAFGKGLRLIFRKWGRPDVCQANVLTRCGVLAYWLKLRYGTPYVIVEHWTRYLPTSFNYYGFLRRLATKIVVGNAKCVMPVSNDLRNAMQRCGLRNDNYMRINNVVDDFFFAPRQTHERSKKRMLHISCFKDVHKNISGLLRATAQLSAHRADFELVLVGTGPDFDDMVRQARQLGLADDAARFVGEKTPEEVCQWVHDSDFLVMFSNYETAGVIFSEAWACGKPVISTPVGIIPEYLTPQNGKSVPVGDETALCETMSWMLDNFQTFDPDIIRETARKFTYDEVGKRLLQVYKTATR